MVPTSGVCLCSCPTTEDHTCSLLPDLLAVDCWKQCSGGPWAVLQVILISPKLKKHWRKKTINHWDTWKITACTMTSVCVHVNRCTTAALDIFSPVLQEVPNFRPCVSCGISLQYKLSICIADNSDFTHNRVPFIWKLPYSTEKFVPEWD